MSIRLMAQIWETDLTTSEKCVMLAMADHANDDGYCYPGQDRVAKKSSLSVRSVGRIQKDLTKRGYLVRLSRGGKIGETSVSAQWVVKPQPDTMSGGGIPQPDIHEPQPDISDTPTGHQTRPNLTPRPVNRQITTIETPDGTTRRDLVWETVVAIHGEPATKGERGKFNRAVKKLKDAEVTPEEYIALVAAYKDRYPDLEPAVMTVPERVGELRHYIQKGPMRSPTKIDKTRENTRRALGG